MGLTISSLLQNMFGRKHMKILMLGLDGAGKTTVLYQLKLGEVLSATPTIGFNVESVDYKNISFTVWDVGGQERIRQLWRFYFDDADGLIYVIDCNDRARVGEAAKELESLLREPQLQNIVTLVLANKQDLPEAIDGSELAERLGLARFPGTSARQWRVQPCVATCARGLYEGLDWLSSQLSSAE